MCFVDLDGDGTSAAPTPWLSDRTVTARDPGRVHQRIDDCNDNDPTAINPTREEIPDDGIDQDCNGADTITCFVDADQDGFGTDWDHRPGR